MIDFGCYNFSFRDLPPEVEANIVTGVGRQHKRGRQKVETYHKQKKKAAARMNKQSRKRNRGSDHG